MKLSKNAKLVSGIGLALFGLSLILIYLLRSPAHEITLTELDQLIQARGITHGQVIPTPYAGIYHVEGTRQAGGKPQNFSITTHLDETQIASLFAQAGMKVEMPGEGMRRQREKHPR